jgi:hypothetical protein
MTRKTASDINYLDINETWPVAGEDNDTQTLRDNFGSIKDGLQFAKAENTDILANAAFLDVDNDFQSNELSNAVLRNTMFKKFDGGIIDNTTALLTVDYENGNYQVFRFDADMNIDFQNLPENSSASGPVGVGKITLELYSGSSASHNLTFITSGGALLRRNSTFPGTVAVGSTSAPIIIDVWRHNATYIFMHYYGQYS